MTERSDSVEGGRPEVLVCRALSRSYPVVDGGALHVLQGADLSVGEGEVVSVTGESGAGKSTLLQLLGGLDRPTSGTVVVRGQALDTLNERDLARFRNQRVGFVFQFHHLLRGFSALENVMMPQLIAAVSRSEARKRAEELLLRVGLGERLGHSPAQLSGGEQQRVAVARALANRPDVLLADEPSGNLDMKTSGRLHDLLFEVAREESSAMVLVTHNRDLAHRADRELQMEEGKLLDIREVMQSRVGDRHEV